MADSAADEFGSTKPHLELVLRLLLGRCDSLTFACLDRTLFILALF